MPLTRDFKDTIRERARRDPAFSQALAGGAIGCALSGDHQTAQTILRDYSPTPGRSLADCLALATDYEARHGEAPLPDDAFATDVSAAIEARRDSFEPPSWD